MHAPLLALALVAGASKKPFLDPGKHSINVDYVEFSATKVAHKPFPILDRRLRHYAGMLKFHGFNAIDVTSAVHFVLQRGETRTIAMGRRKYAMTFDAKGLEMVWLNPPPMIKTPASLATGPTGWGTGRSSKAGPWHWQMFRAE